MKPYAAAALVTLIPALSTTAHAVLCFKKKGTVVQRSAACRANEQPVPSGDLGVGPAGPAGPSSAIFVEAGDHPVNNEDGSVHTGELFLLAGSYVVHGAVNLVNDGDSTAQVACRVTPETTFGTKTYMRTTLPAVAGGPGHVALVAAGTLTDATNVFIDCSNDTPGGLAHVENMTIVAIKVDSAQPPPP
jgi:hypothetical protein